MPTAPEPKGGKQMLPDEETKKWLIENRTNGKGELDLSGLDFSDFTGNVHISGCKVGGSLFQDEQEVGGILYQDDRKLECVEPDYKAEYERLSKELIDANRKIEALMWALGKIKDAEGGK